MTNFLENPLFLLALTLVIYYGTSVLQKRFRFLLLNPIIITMAVLIGYLTIFNIQYETYQQAGNYIDFWLKPSVVALGVPLFIELERIKKQLIPLIISQLLGSLIGIISVCLIAKNLGATRELILSLAPKSVTTPIAIEITKTIGGVPALTATMVILTGILGTILGLKFLQWFRIKSPMAQGIALGSSAHGMGIIVAGKLSPKYAAFASLGLIFSGIFTALLAPHTIKLLDYFSLL